MKNIKKRTIIIVAVLVILIGGICFYGGMKYSEQNRKIFNFRDFQNMEGLQKTGPTGMSRGGVINGEIIDKDEQKIIIKSAEGSSKIIFLSEKTMINKTIEANLNDLQIGEKIMANGKANDDGSITAESIQLTGNLTVKPDFQPKN
jgi:hypothetical protein